jgi:hypothetical protein
MRYTRPKSYGTCQGRRTGRETCPTDLSVKELVSIPLEHLKCCHRNSLDAKFSTCTGSVKTQTHIRRNLGVGGEYNTLSAQRGYQRTERTYVVSDTHTRTAHESSPPCLPPYLLDQAGQGCLLRHITTWGGDGHVTSTGLPSCSDNVKGIGYNCCR